jgi:hypothetical protein
MPKRPTPALLISLLALFVALGGTSAAQDAVTSAVKKITGKQLASNAVTSSKVKDRSLLAKDIKTGQLLTPAAAGAAFQPKGNYQPAGNYLGATAKAADAELLDGKDSAAFLGKTEQAADAATVDGVDSQQLVQTGGGGQTGQTNYARRELNDSAVANGFMALPGLGSFNFTCSATGTVNLNFDADVLVDVTENFGAPSWSTISGGGNALLLSSNSGVAAFDVMIGRSGFLSSRLATVHFVAEGQGDGNGCRLMASSINQAFTFIAGK